MQDFIKASLFISSPFQVHHFSTKASGSKCSVLTNVSLCYNKLRKNLCNITLRCHWISSFFTVEISINIPVQCFGLLNCIGCVNVLNYVGWHSLSCICMSDDFAHTRVHKAHTRLHNVRENRCDKTEIYMCTKSARF